MKPEETKLFIRQLFASFPDLAEWVNEKSPDASETIRSWGITLEPFSLDECQKILADWIRGKKPLYMPYERGHIALVIRARILFDRDALSRHQRGLEEVRKHQQRVAERGPSRYKSCLTQLWAKCQEATRRLNAGEITEQEWYRIRDELVAEAGR